MQAVQQTPLRPPRPSRTPREQDRPEGQRLVRHRARNTAGGERGARADLRNTWQVVVGSLLIPLGVMLILMAWYGSAHTHFVQQQIPYLVSGSFAGLGCMILGGLLYWAHWLYRLFDQADQHHEEELAVLGQLIAPLAQVAGRTQPSGAMAPADNGETIFVATSHGTTYHRRDCPVANRNMGQLRELSEQERVGLRPCPVCGAQP